jgi:hypothetical protein
MLASFIITINYDILKNKLFAIQRQFYEFRVFDKFSGIKKLKMHNFCVLEKYLLDASQV